VGEAHRRSQACDRPRDDAAGTRRAIDAGVDGLGHLFFDRVPAADLVADIASAGVFVMRTLVTLSSAFGNSAGALATACDV
jgi:hypothetical protein